eukprot:scaffold305948_cov19-Tisochrysis_lutea.AAC.1
MGIRRVTSLAKGKTLKLAVKLHHHALMTLRTKITSTKYAIQISNPSNGVLGVEATGRDPYRKVRQAWKDGRQPAGST